MWAKRKCQTHETCLRLARIDRDKVLNKQCLIVLMKLLLILLLLPLYYLLHYIFNFKMLTIE